MDALTRLISAIKALKLKLDVQQEALKSIEQRVNTLPTAEGKAGEQGEKGEKGDTGLSGKDGKDGKDGINGKNGKDGLKGADGKNGKDGKDGDKGEKGDKGDDGLSAFQVALINGFDGDEDQWLRSLRGREGAQGGRGIKGEKGDAGADANLSNVLGTTDQITVTDNGDDTITLDLADQVVDNIKADTNFTTGFVSRTTSTLALNAGTRVFTIAPTSTSFNIYIKGIRYAKTAQTTTIPNTKGLHYIFFDNTGTLQNSLSAWSITGDGVPVATIYWNGTAGAIGDERHSAARNATWHQWAHDTIGMRYESGLVGSFSTASTSFTSGQLHDEDIELSVPAQSGNCVRVFYNDTGATAMTFDATAVATTAKITTGALKWDNAGTLTSVATSKYVCNWVYGSNDKDYPIYCVVGQAEHNTLALARSTGLPNLSTLPSAELKLLYKVIWQNVGGTPTYIESSDFRTSSTLPSGGTTATNAGSVTVTPFGNVSSTNAQAALEEMEIEVPKYGMARQAVIDGNFQIAQSATTVTNPTSGTYPVFDMWKVLIDANGGSLPTYILSQQAITAGELFKSSKHARLNVNGAGASLGAGSYCSFTQYVESGVRNLCGAGKYITLSFWAKSSIANKKLGVELRQNYGSGGSPTAEETLNGANWTLTTTWAKYTYTWTTNTLVGKTFGTADDDHLRLFFWAMWGSTYQAQVGASAPETFVGSGDIDIAQVQLCSGNTALDFEPKPFHDEFQASKRFFERSYDYGTATGASTSVGAMSDEVVTTSANSYELQDSCRFQVQKRIIPVVYMYSTTGAGGTGTAGKVRDTTAAADKTVAIDSIGQNGFFSYFNNQSVTTGDDILWHWTADARY